MHRRVPVSLLLFVTLSLSAASGAPPQSEPQSSPAAASKKPPTKVTPREPSPDEELQQAINAAANDRAALLRNLEAFLKKYPESAQRPQIYRALVEASLQLRDSTRATDYAERIVALAPEDMSMTLLTIELLERNGDEGAIHRAVNYATRVLEYVQRSAADEKPPRVSLEEWNAQKRRDATAVLVMRGRLHMKLKDNAEAQKDLEESYRQQPSAAAAAKLGELAELRKDLPAAITNYARAFALAEGANANSNRREVRQKLGNAWRLAHGSDDGLGEFLLHTFDDVAKLPALAAAARNNGVKDVREFQIRKAPEGTPLPMASFKDKILVLNFWATWCGPCHILAPIFDRVASQFEPGAGVAFLAVNCDEDESLVAPYLAAEKTRTAVVFADGLERALAVNAFPTVLILDRSGKIVYGAYVYSDQRLEAQLTSAVQAALAAK